MSETQRGVVFTFKAQADESIGREFAAIGERGEQLQEMLGNFKLGGLDVSQFETALDKANAKLDAVQKRAVSPVNLTAFSTSAVATPPITAAPSPLGGRSLPTAGGADEVAAPASKADSAAAKLAASQKAALDKALAAKKAAADKAEAADRAAADKEAANRQRAEDKKIAAANRTLAVMVANGEKGPGQDRAAADKAIAQFQREATAAEKAADQVEKANAKEVDALIKGWDNDAAAKQKAEEKKLAAANRTLAELVKGGSEAVRKEEESQERATEAHQRAEKKLAAINAHLRASFAEVVRSSTELARGLVELGLVREQDFEKIAKSILAVQSAADQIRGVVGIWQAASEAAKLYHERLELIAKAEKLAAAAHGASGAAQAAGHAAGAAGAVGAVGNGAGLAGLLGVAANPVTLALAAAAAAAIAAAFALKKLKEASEEAEKKAAAARKQELEIREAQNAALLQVFDAEKHAREQNNARQNTALKVSQMVGEKRGEYEAAADERGLKGPELADARERFIASQAAIDRNKQEQEQAQQELAAAQQLANRSREMPQQKPQEPPKPAGTRITIGDVVDVMLPGARSIARGIGLEPPKENEIKTKPAAGFNPFAAGEGAEQEETQGVEAAQQRIADLQSQAIELAQQAGRVEIQNLQEEIGLQRQLIEGDKQRVESAKQYANQTHKALEDALVEFGMLSKGQQQKTLRLMDRLDKGEKLLRPELQFVMQHGDEKAKTQARKQVVENLPPELQGRFQNERRRADEGATNYAGALAALGEHERRLTEIFGKLEQSNERMAGGEKGQVEVNAKGEAVVTLKWDSDQSKILAKAFTPQFEKWADAILENTAKMIAAANLELQRKIQQKAQTGAAGA